MLLVPSVDLPEEETNYILKIAESVLTNSAQKMKIMKTVQKFILCVCATSLCLVSFLSATVRIVDGTGGATLKYASLSAALSAAVAGDTISILAGIYNESTPPVVVGKKVTIIGNGYKGTSLNQTQIKYALSVTSVGVRISRLYFNGTAQQITIDDQSSGCVLSDCLFENSSRLYIYNSNSDTIKNNIFRSSNNSYGYLYVYGTSSKILIANNVFNGISTTTTYGIQTNNSLSEIKIINNHFDDYYYPLYASTNDYSPFYITGNIFVKGKTITTSAQPAGLYSGNWLFNVPSNPSQPSNGSSNGSGDPQFVNYDVSKGFVYTGDQLTDTDLRIKTTATPFPDSPIDGSFPPVSPLGFGYVDVQQQPGNINSNRADIGIFGGPFPFPSPFTPSTIPSASTISVTPNPVGPKGTINVNVTGGFGN
jgi:hypothetical protein